VRFAHEAARVVSGGSGRSVGLREGCGQGGEQEIEAAVEFGGAVVGGEGTCGCAQLGEFGDRVPVQAEREDVIVFLGRSMTSCNSLRMWP